VKHVLHLCDGCVAHGGEADPESSDTLFRPVQDVRELDFCGLQIGSDVQRRVENSLWSELIRETHRAAEDSAERDLQRYQK
jgi:hypothetical protein